MISIFSFTSEKYIHIPQIDQILAIFLTSCFFQNIHFYHPDYTENKDKL